MFPVGPGNFPPTRPYPMYFFIFHHEEDRICLTTLSGADRTKKINLTLPIIIPHPPPPPPARNGQKNGPQSLDANDVMGNARGLPSGDVEDSNRPFRSFPGPLFQNESRCSAFDMVDCTTRFV